MLNGIEPLEPAAWLAAIARNECRGRIAARMREPLAARDAEAIPGGVDPVAEALRRADLAALWRAIRALPPTQRDALLLREFGGLRYDELAAALAVTEPAVESLLVRARTQLRAQLRAAYAAVTGGAWLEWLARVATGSAGPAAAAKAVTLGLGAAAVTSGAVVGPRLTPHRQLPRQPTVARTTTEARRTPPPPAVAAVLAPVAVVHEIASTTTTRRSRRHGAEHRAPTVLPEPEQEQEPQEQHDDGTTTSATTTTATTTTTTTTLEEHGGGGGDDGEGGGEGGDRLDR